MVLSKNELTALINTAFDAVNNSKAGPIYGTQPDPNTGEPQRFVNFIGRDAFLTILGCIIPKAFQAENTFSPKEIVEAFEKQE